MKVDLKFIPQNTALKGAKNIGLYDSNGNKLKNIPLGNLAPKSKGNKLYTFGAISDVHLPYNTGTDDFVRALNYLNNEEKVDFICISGDMGSVGTDAEWASYKNYVDTYSPNTTVHISAGNHDAGQSAPKTYDYPIPYTGNPLYYSFTQGDDVFIIFGMSLWGNPPFTNESLQWLYETLESNRNKRCFVFQHMMRKGHAGDASGRYSWDGLNNTNGKVFLSLMEHYKNVLWFHGHSHCEFEQQDTLALPNSNYDRVFGCHSIHVPSCCMTRNENNSYDYEDSEGYVIDVYKNGIHLRGRDFIAKKFLPIASYWIDTKLAEIKANTYSDPYGVIDTGNNTEGSIIIPTGSEVYLNQRYSQSGGGLVSDTGDFAVLIPMTYKVNTTYTLKIENLSFLITSNSGNTLYAINSSTMESVGYPAGIQHFDAMSPDVLTVNDNGSLVEVMCTPKSGMTHLALSIAMSNSQVLTEKDLNGIVISLEENEASSIVIPEGTEMYFGQRFSQSGGGLVTDSTSSGMVAFAIPIEYDSSATYRLSIENLPLSITEHRNNTIYGADSTKTTLSTITSSGIFADMVNGLTTTNGGKNSQLEFKITEETKFIALSLLFANDGSVTEDDIKGVVISLKEVKPFVNIVPTLLDTDLTNVFNSIGYKENARVKSTGEVIDIPANHKTTLTGLIPLEKDGDVLHVRGVDRVTYIDGRYVGWYSLWDSTGAFLFNGAVIPTSLVSTDENDDFTITLDYTTLKVNEYPTASYIRLQVGKVADKLIITRNQLIEEPINYTNLLPSSIDANGNDFVGANGEDGYKTGYRLRTTGVELEKENACVTGFMPCNDVYAKIRMKNYTLFDPNQLVTDVDRIVYYNANKEYVYQHPIFTTSSGVKEESEGVIVISPYVYTSEVAYFRISTGVINENTIITVNERI